VYTVGNPIRAEILALPAPDKRFNHPEQTIHLLVLGGSLGAQAINLSLPKALAKLPEAIRPAVWHQTGEKHLADTRKAYEMAGVKAEIVPFIVEMDKAYSWADVVLCRAGASTIAELCAVGLGGILVPFPYAIDDHQTANAQFMSTQQAAILVQQAHLTVDSLAEMLEKLGGSSGEQCVTMAKAAYALRQVDATEKIITICKEIYQ
jgi:UDP-N-acetylglucosamine--N-acetylmuramyl-(pentapeptide) pyrophosphoryl-undecaprenol N-acetylglucosamine transferase